LPKKFHLLGICRVIGSKRIEELPMQNRSPPEHPEPFSLKLPLFKFNFVC